MNQPTNSTHEAEARLALLQALYLQVGLNFAAAREAALADYASLFCEIEAMAA